MSTPQPTQVMRLTGHTSLHQLAVQTGSYPKALEALAKRDGITIVTRLGIRFVKDADVQTLTAAWQNWRDRPRLTTPHRAARRRERPSTTPALQPAV